MEMKKLSACPADLREKATPRCRQRTLFLICMICGFWLFALPLSATNALAQAEATAAPEEPSGRDVGEVGHKLANPLADLWALQMVFETPKFLDGDVNTGDPKVGAGMTFQPVMPFPLYGEGAAEWRLVTRPIIPLIFSEPIPKGFDEFDHKGGIGDIQVPLVLSFPEKYVGKWILGTGPVGLLPTATDHDLGSDQWALGPAVAIGYKTEKLTAVIFPNYFWKVGSSGQDDKTPDISRGSLFYSINYSLPNAWEVGMNPTITYNDNADSGNKWNVPVGLYAGKTVKFGNMPVNFRAGFEYSVVSEDDFGKRGSFIVQITPVVQSLITKPIFGK